jgi:hypothetical protein
MSIGGLSGKSTKKGFVGDYRMRTSFVIGNTGLSEERRRCLGIQASLCERGYILDKLLAFHIAHQTPWPEILRDLQNALEQIPKSEHAAEAEPLADRILAARKRGKTGPQPLSGILAVVLARFGVGMLPSTPSGEKDLT